MEPELLERILNTPRFREGLTIAETRGVLEDLTAIEGTDSPEVDWNYLLLCGSLLVKADDERAQQAALRISQTCLTSAETDERQRAAAVVLLERMGNRPAIDLAQGRDLVGVDEWERLSPPLQIDIMRKRMELTIPLLTDSLRANTFQRRFWTAAAQTEWLSVSAATSVGKSFIVKKWFEERIAAAEQFKGVYLVPTRALIEEVTNDLRLVLPPEIGVYAFPWDPEIGNRPKEVFVLTQERLHLLQQRFLEFSADLIFVDEAQKFGDDGRGVLLQRALDDATSRSRDVQVVFASPLSLNPELLLEAAPPSATRADLSSDAVTVLQNLIWANQVRGHPTVWALDLVTDDFTREIGRVQLQARPQPASKRLPLLAVALGKSAGSSVIYVNGAGEAEKTAQQAFEALGPNSDVAGNPDIAALIELSEKTVHRSYALSTVLRRGVAFHYGNMPLLLRSEIERLFRIGTLKYLVCTSTLLEGVNLPCKNLFMRGPQRGRGRPLSPADFWNLAGRAGRWGQEFQGNIICVDTDDRDRWPVPPSRRVRYPLRRVTDDVLLNAEALIRYIDDGTPLDAGQGPLPLESVFSFLAAKIGAGQSLSGLPGLSALSAKQIFDIETSVRTALEGVDVPHNLVARHAGISPLSMQRLLLHFRDHDEPVALAISPPESRDAVETIVSAFGRIGDTLGTPFGSPARRWMLALLVVEWMRGYPLARIIAGRLQYLEERDRPFKVAAVIRECMTDVEQIARFEAPKYLSCYVDILRHHYLQTGRPDAMAALPDMAMLLELGVSRATELSLMTLGLSRTSAIALSEYIVEDELTPPECQAWLAEHDLDHLDIPELVRREIRTALQRPRPDSA